MARIRTIKPEFFTSDDVCALSPLARLLFIGCWCEADREGRLEWKPRSLKRKYLPEDDCDAEQVAASLVDQGLIVLYGQGLAVIPTFGEHQVINLREAQSKLPEPPTVTCNAHAFPAIAPGKGKEGKGTGKDEVEESPTASTDSAASASQGDGKRGTRISDDWKLTPELRGFASDLGLDPDVTCEAFVDYWRGVPGAKGRKLDWPATFRNRCRDLAKPGLKARGTETFDQRRIREAREAIRQ